MLKLRELAGDVEESVAKQLDTAGVPSSFLAARYSCRFIIAVSSTVGPSTFASEVELMERILPKFRRHPELLKERLLGQLEKNWHAHRESDAHRHGRAC